MAELNEYNAVKVDGKVILHTLDPSVVRAVHVLHDWFRQSPGEIRIGHPTTEVTTMHYIPDGADVQYLYSVSDYESVEPHQEMVAVAMMKPEERTIPIVNQGFVDDAIIRSHPDFQ